MVARPRGGARARGLALGTGDRRGHERAAHAPGLRPPAAAVAHAPPGALGRVARPGRGDRGDRADHRRRQRAPRRRRPAGRRLARRPGSRSQLGQTAAHDYNPFGTGPENRDLIGNVVDGDPNTTWSTEQYYDGTLQQARRRRARASTSTPRRACWRGRSKIQTRRRASPRRSTWPTTSISNCRTATPRRFARAAGRDRSARAATCAAASASPLSLTGHPYRYYLVWMTTLPPNMQSATIDELTLFK